MSCLTMATVESRIPMNLRNNELEHHLLGRSLFGLPIQEAVLQNQLVLGFHISQDSFSVCYLQQGFSEGLSRSLSMLDYLIENGVLLLFKLPINNISGGQSSRPHTNSYFLASFLIVWVRPNSLLSSIC